MIYLDDIAQFLASFFAVERFSNDQNGIYVPSKRAIARLGLALEPWSDLAKWTRKEHIDALFLHRPWQLQPEKLPADIGVIAYHLAFDEYLTLGFNPRLATVLGMSNLEVLGKKEERPIGMIGEIARHNFDSYCDRIDQVFDGYDKADLGNCTEILRVAVVGAMNDALVREAAERGANIYITGQLRQPAEDALLETGIGYVAVGHRRCEEWGLKALGGVLRERWAKLEILFPN